MIFQYIPVSSSPTCSYRLVHSLKSEKEHQPSHPALLTSDFLGSIYGFVQLLFLFCVYGFILCWAGDTSHPWQLIISKTRIP